MKIEPIYLINSLKDYFDILFGIGCTPPILGFCPPFKSPAGDRYTGFLGSLQTTMADCIGASKNTFYYTDKQNHTKLLYLPSII